MLSCDDEDVSRIGWGTGRSAIDGGFFSDINCPPDEDLSELYEETLHDGVLELPVQCPTRPCVVHVMTCIRTTRLEYVEKNLTQSMPISDMFRGQGAQARPLRRVESWTREHEAITKL